MPALNKQTLINLLIDSPLREPIKINLIDIVNNTADADLPKTYSTISKELEIFQKATERRMKLAEETIAKLKEDGGGASDPSAEPSSLPPLPPLPATPPATPMQSESNIPMYNPSSDEPTALKVPPLDLPPMPAPSIAADETVPTPPASDSAPLPTTPAVPAEAPIPPAPTPASPASADEDALKEIQKELDSLKSTAADEAAPAAPATPPQV